MSYAQPRWSTPRTPGRPTYGDAIAKAAAALGRPLRPWQRDVANIIGEVVPDERGGWRMAYPVVVLIVPRRAGKTVLELAVKTQRCASHRDHRAWYTAQTGGDAGGKFRKDWVPAFKAPGVKRLVDKPRLSNGSEGIGFKRTGSRIGIFAPTETALHGEDSDDVTVDEAWAFDRLRGGLIEAAVRPTMATRQLRQLRIVSAGGTAESTWLLDWRERGRATSGMADQGIAYFEWHPAVDELGAIIDDLDDPATWAATHPSVGRGPGTIPLDVLAEDWRTMVTPEGDRGLFYRSYLDVFTGSSAPRIYPRQEWNACRDPELALPTGYGLTLAYDVSPDQRHASVSLAIRLDEQRVGAEVVDVELSDPEWLADRVEKLQRRYGAQLVADSVGPATATTRELRQRGLYVTELDTTEACDAASGLLADVLAARNKLDGSLRPEGGRFVHRGQRQLDEAVDAAIKREVGDRWAITRKGSEGDVTPLTSVAFAVAHAKTYPVGELGPLVEFATG